MKKYLIILLFPMTILSLPEMKAFTLGEKFKTFCKKNNEDSALFVKPTKAETEFYRAADYYTLALLITGPIVIPIGLLGVSSCYGALTAIYMCKGLGTLIENNYRRIVNRRDQYHTDKENLKTIKK
jgi:hypothetical protein